ncbi:hypothetical protein KW790_02650 [Candidatus Parcubacteria bacterium]|nr:hypothetical protein [Candidatus Parcubacteria bacterium]
MIGTRHKTYIFLGLLITFSIFNANKVLAGQTTFTAGSAFTCQATFTASIPSGSFIPGQIVAITGTANLSGSCTGVFITSFSFNQSGGGGFGGSMTNNGGGNYSGSFTAPGTSGTYTVNFSGSTNTASGSGSITYTVSGPVTATFTVTACSEGGTWTIDSPAGTTYSPPSPVTVAVAQAGQLTTVNYTPPSGYNASAQIDGSAGWSTWTIRGGAYTVVVTCTPVSPVPTVSVTANPRSILSGQSSTISWASTNATSCTTTSGWPPSGALSGSTVVSPTVNTTYDMTCSGPGGTSPQASDTVTVDSSATINVTSNNSSGSWTLTGGQSGSGTSGGPYIVPVTPPFSTYTLTPGAVSGYSVSVNNTDNSGSSMSMYPGDSKSFSIVYTSSAAFNYSLTNSGNVTATQGDLQSEPATTITRHYIAGTSQPVDIVVTNAPAGVGFNNTAPGGCSPDCGTDMRLAPIPYTVTPGNYSIDVEGFLNSDPSNAAYYKHTTFTLTVLSSPNLFVSCVPSSGTARVGESVTWTATAQGGSGVYTSYSWSGLGIPTSPAPSTRTFNITYSTVGAKTATATVTDDSGHSGTCTPGTIQINFKPIFKEI